MTNAAQVTARALPPLYGLRLRFERSLVWQSAFVALAPFLIATAAAAARWEKAKDFSDFVVLGLAALVFFGLLAPAIGLWVMLAARAFQQAPREAAALARGSVIAATVSEEHGVRAARFVVDGVARVVRVNGVDVGAVVNVVCGPNLACHLAALPGKPRIEGGAVVVDGNAFAAVVGLVGFVGAFVGLVAVTVWALTGVIPVALFIVRL